MEVWTKQQRRQAERHCHCKKGNREWVSQAGGGSKQEKKREIWETVGKSSINIHRLPVLLKYFITSSCLMLRIITRDPPPLPTATPPPTQTLAYTLTWIHMNTTSQRHIHEPTHNANRHKWEGKHTVLCMAYSDINTHAQYWQLIHAIHVNNCSYTCARHE